MEEILKTPETAAVEAETEAAAAVEAVAGAAEEAVEAVKAVTEDAVEAVQAAEAVAQDAAQTAEAAAEKAAPEAPKESMEDFKDELEASFRTIREGDILTGTVISVSETEILMDLDYYAPGVIPLQDASDDPSFILKEHVQPGQKLSATVVKKDDGAGRILLSTKEAATQLAWDRLRTLLKDQGNVTVKISGVTKGGAITMLEGIRGFIPASKLALGYVEENDLPNWIGKSIEARVITAEEEGRHLVLSAKEILREKASEERAKRISNVEVGLVTEGTVDTIKPYGAFVNLGNGLSGLLHVSQISQQRIKTPEDVLSVGQKVKVKIIANKDGKLSLSMKALEDAAPAKIEEETFELPKSENIGTSLGSLFKNLKLN